METEIRSRIKKKTYSFLKFFIASILIFSLLCETWYAFFKVFFLILIEGEKTTLNDNLIALALSFSFGAVLLMYFRKIFRLIRFLSGIEDHD